MNDELRRIKNPKKGKTVTLLIDTSSNQLIKVGLRIDNKEYISSQKIGKKKAQVVLPMIQKILEKGNLKLGDLTGIEVNNGPGSFTGVRVGITIANVLSFVLKIPVNGLKKGIVAPVYE